MAKKYHILGRAQDTHKKGSTVKLHAVDNFPPLYTGIAGAKLHKGDLVYMDRDSGKLMPLLMKPPPKKPDTVGLCARCHEPLIQTPWNTKVGEIYCDNPRCERYHTPAGSVELPTDPFRTQAQVTERMYS